MTHKIVRADGTVIQNVKKCIYAEDVNGEANLRPGCVSSAHIDVTVFGLKKNAPEAGEELLYYWVDANGAETLVGHFYAEPAINSRMTYRFIAYDAVAKLDADFSARLNELQSSFPMTLGDLVSEAATVVGVGLYTTSFPRSSVSINAFYADNITCRQILSWAGEFNGKFVRCGADGLLRFDWYTQKSGYRIYPTVTNLPLIIRQPSDINAPARTVYMTVLASNVTSYQWQYRISASGIWRNSTATSATTKRLLINNRAAVDGFQYKCVLTNANGTVETEVATLTLDSSGSYSIPTDELHSDTEITVPYKQNGLSYENYSISPIDGVTVFSADEGASSVSWPQSVSGTNILTIYNNLLLTDASNDVLLNTAFNCYIAMTSLPEYRPAMVNLFPSENPFRAGDIVPVTDAQGFSFATVIMAMTVDNAVAKIRSSGEETYEEEEQFNAKTKIVNMASSILRLKKLIVEELDALVARIDTLFANEITVTGSLHSPDYQIVENSYSYNQPYAATGLGLEFGDGSINGQYFAVSRNGGVYSREAYFGDFHFADALRSSYTEMNIAPYQFLDSGGTASTNYEAITAAELINNSYDAIKPKARSSISGYKANEKGKFVYHISTVSNGLNEIRYLNFNAIADSSIVDLLDKPVATVTYPASGQGTIVDQGSVTLEYGTYYPGTFNSLMNYKDALFYPVLPHPSATDLIVEIEVPAGAVIELDVVRGYYSAWYSQNNSHTYGGRGTYLGTDGISADKMQVNGNDVWNKGDFTLPLPIEQGGTGATTAIDSLNNLNGAAILSIGYTTSSAPKTLTFSGSVRFVLFVSGTTSQRMGAAMVHCQNSTSTAVVAPLGEIGSTITITPGSGSITINTSVSSAGVMYCYALCLTNNTYNRITVS